MRNRILYFFLLVLKLFFNLTLNIIYKRSGFPKAFLKKDLKFVSCRRVSLVKFHLGLMLLVTKVDSILEEQNCKRNAFLAFCSSRFETVPVLLTEIVAFHEQVSKV